MKVKNWNELDTVPMFNLVSRKSFSGSSLTVARVNLGKGSVVPGHSHPNEQVTVVLKGKVLFTGENEGKTATAGDIVHTPPGAYHTVSALEESLVLDIFSPARSDWPESCKT